MRVILFFGTFNPIHNGHMLAAINAMKAIGAAKVIFVPAYESFHDKPNESYFVNAINRYYMIKAAIKDINEFEVSNFEINQQRKVYTIETLKYYSHKYYRDHMYILMGYDLLKTFYKWKEADQILKYASIIAYKRDGVEIDKNLYPASDFIFLEQQSNNINSSWIRQNRLIDYLPLGTLDYINEYGIYLDKRLQNFISPRRFQHSLRVALMCYEVMEKYDPANMLKGWVAGAYHDICKELGETQTYRMMNEYQMQSQLSWKVMHGPIAKYFLADVFKFKDPMVLNAIANHTIPDLNSNLTILDKVLFCCDKLEPARTDKDVENIEYYRKLLKEDLDKCFNELYAYQRDLFKRLKKPKLINDDGTLVDQTKLMNYEGLKVINEDSKENNNTKNANEKQTKEIKNDNKYPIIDRKVVLRKEFAVSGGKKHIVVPVADYEKYDFNKRRKQWDKWAGHNKKDVVCSICNQKDNLETIELDNGQHVCYYCWMGEPKKKINKIVVAKNNDKKELTKNKKKKANTKKVLK